MRHNKNANQFLRNHLSLAWIYTILFLYFSLSLVLNEKMFQTLKTVFHHSSKVILENSSYSTVHMVFSVLFTVFGKCHKIDSTMHDKYACFESLAMY